MSQIKLLCPWCGIEFFKYSGEITRQLKKGRTKFFCSLSCGAHHHNQVVGNTSLEIEKECLYCHKKFMSTTKKKGAVFCSRSCASAGSVTEHRRNIAKQNGLQNAKYFCSIEQLASNLRSREMPKYQLLKDYLNQLKIYHLFEKPLDNFIFDLALPDLKILVEFDGPYHKNEGQIQVDLKKEEVAKSHGWSLKRIQVDVGQIINPELIKDLFTNL